MPSRDLVFRFIGMDAGAGHEFDRMAGKSATVEKAVGKLALGFVVTGAAVAVESVRMAAKFQQSMELIHTQAGRSQAAVNEMSKSVLQLAGPTATAPDELAKGLYHLASTGLSTAKSLDALKIAAEGAKMGGADLEAVTNALNATIASGIKGSGDFAKAMGALNAVVGSGDMRMQDLAEAMGTGVLAAVKGFGLSLNDVGAALATFGDNNIRGADAATQLRMAVLFMAKPAASAKGALKELGLTSHTLADDMGKGGLGLALTDLHNHLIKAGDTGAKMGQVLLDMFGHKAGTGISILEQQFGRFQSKQEEVAKGSKNFASDWTSYTKTFGYSWDRARSAFESMTIQLGEKLLPTATKAMNWIGTKGVADLEKFTGWVSRNKTPIEDVAKALAAIAAVRIGAGLIGKVNGVGRLLTGSGGGGIVGSAEGAMGTRVFVTNMPAGGIGAGSGGGGVLKTAEKDAEKYGPGALPWLSKIPLVGRLFSGTLGAGLALTGATLTDKLGPATHSVPGGKVRADAPANLKTLLAQVQQLTKHNAAAAASFKALGGSIDIKKVQAWVAEWKNAGTGVREVDAITVAAAHRMVVAHQRAVSDVTAQLRKIPGAMKTIAAEAQAAGTNIGTMLDAGLTVGIRAGADRVNIVTKTMVDGVVQTATHAAALGSPSKKTMYIGQMISAGMAVGIRQASRDVEAAAKDLADKALSRLDTVRGKISGMVSGISDNLAQGASLSNVPSMDSLGSPMAPTIGGITTFLSGYASRERAFQRNLGLARKRGLSAGEAANIAQMGLDAGGPLAQTLAHATRHQIGVVNRDLSDIGTMSRQIGTSSANAIYGRQERDLLAAQKRANHFLELMTQLQRRGQVRLDEHTITQIAQAVSRLHITTDNIRLDKRNGTAVITASR